jgi:hypothetical protein
LFGGTGNGFGYAGRKVPQIYSSLAEIVDDDKIADILFS